jgi:hypothetical protein
MKNIVDHRRPACLASKNSAVEAKNERDIIHSSSENADHDAMPSRAAM